MVVCFLFEVDAPAPSEIRRKGVDGAEGWLLIEYEDQGVLGPRRVPRTGG
jgi:hypothetical protein